MIMKSIKIAGLTLIAAMTALSANAGEIVLDAKMATFQPVRDVEPVYPQRAIDRKISGFTLVEYNIDEDGRPDNVKVIDSEPSKVFDIASKRAILRTVYDKDDAAEVTGDTFYRLYVYELDDTNANTLASGF